MDYFVEISEDHLRKERAKARELRRSNWWKNRIATGNCYYCNGGFKPRDLTLDHVVPLVRGGKTTKGNCVPACKECNSKKQDLLPSEWREYLNRLQQQ